MPAKLSFRDAEPRDAAALSELLGELGYPASAEEVPRRLATLAQLPRVLVLVATIDDEVVGLITTHVYPTIHADKPVALITALVVSSRHRGKGVGAELVAQAESWAAENGVWRISVGSGLQRLDTHRFYEGIGYTRSGVRFAKVLAKDVV